MKKIIVFILCVFLVPLSSFKTTHKFYVSVTQIEYNQQQQSLQMISRVFIDDIEELLKERYSESILLGLHQETVGVDEYLKKYFNQKLLINVNGKKKSFNFIGKEYEEDLVICYLEIENISSLDVIEVSNQVLMDLFEEQQNIIHVKKGKQRKSLILEKGKDNGVLKFSK